MRKIISLLILILLAGNSRLQNPAPGSEVWTAFNKATEFYNGAELLAYSEDYDEEAELKLNRQALEQFRKAASLAQSFPGVFDSLLFHAYSRIGVLEHYFGNLQPALKAYGTAINIGSSGIVKDSFLFKPLLYSGSLYYALNQFDSATAYYARAEKVLDSYPLGLVESERLFNTLGAIYFETGNYRNARLYFERAAEALPSHHPYYIELLVNYRMNLAAVLTKLEHFDEADRLYRELLSYKMHENEILHSIGTISLSRGAIEQALSYFRRINYDDLLGIRLYNDYALAYLNLQQYDSARMYIARALQLNDSLNGNRKNIARGLSWKYLGDVQNATGNADSAVASYQKAILQFYPAFSTTDKLQNPHEFSGSFSYINLFHALTAKASVLVKTGSPKNMEAWLNALDAYRSAYKLADYVSLTYDSEEALLFLNRLKHIVHDLPIVLCINLFEQTDNPEFLEEAYLFDQRNKGSVLALQLQTKQSPTSDEIKKLRASITRLSVQGFTLTDSLKLNEINSAIRTQEVELSRLLQKNRESLRVNIEIPSSAKIQKLLDGATTLVSYHIGEEELLILAMTSKKFIYNRVPISDTFYAAIDSFRSRLHQLDRASTYENARVLWKYLFSPIEAEIHNEGRLIIIPDDELHYIPFEALRDDEDQYLLERYAVTYQYSTGLIEQRDINKHDGSTTLAFAPFSESVPGNLGTLPSSRAEIESLKGKKLFAGDATKQEFLRNANHYPVIHLATHALANDTMPERSWIAFYPGDENDLNYKLYAREIANISLDSTRLIILSACETGAGSLVKGEGMMSLSRSFAFAGCPDILTSLWMAEDHVTAFLMKRFHNYMNEGYPLDLALQRSKLDLLHASGEIAPQFKSPNYWSQVVFIGTYQPEKKSFAWLLISACLTLGILLVVFIKKAGRKSGRQIKG